MKKQKLTYEDGQALLQKLCKSIGTSPELIKGEKRNKMIDEDRALIAYFLRTEYKMTFREIGEILNRSRSSPCRASDRYAFLLKKSLPLSLKYTSLYQSQ